jgi:sec-independent protein translocase protein TatA
MPHVGWPELIVILVLALIIFGPQRLAGIGGALGREAENEIEKSTAPKKDA